MVYECTPLEELIRWRLWDRTSAGMMAELGSHQLDAASIFVSALYPEGAAPASLAGRGRGQPPDLRPRSRHRGPRLLHPRIPHARNTTRRTRKRIASKISVQYASINGNGYLNYGELVYGTKGTLALEKEEDLKLLTGSGDEGDTADGGQGLRRRRGPTLEPSPAARSAPRRAGRRRPVSRGYAEELEHWAWCIRHPGPKTSPAALPASPWPMRSSP